MIDADTIFTNGSKLVIVHRGRTLGGPGDNTLEAFAEAVKSGADMVEFDVRRTRDGVLVLHHDARHSRHYVSNLTYDQLKRLPGGEVVPTLAEAVSLLAGKVLLDVEIKAPGYEAEVLKILKAHFKPQQFVVTSFRARVIRRVKELAPSLRAGLLMGDRYLTALHRTAAEIVFAQRRLKSARADFAVCSRWQMGRGGIGARVIAAGYPVLVWGFKQEPPHQRFFADRAIYGVITDRPDIALQGRDQVLDGKKND